MYLRGLGDAYAVMQNAINAGLDAWSANYYANGQWAGTDPLACIRQGGQVTTRYFSTDANGRGNPPVSFGCAMPAAAPPPAANVSVTTATQSTVSPQISPNLVQQDKPSGSAVNAGTVQQNPAPQSSTAGPDQSYLDYLKSVSDQNAKLVELLAAGGGQVVDAGAPGAPGTYYTSASAPVDSGAPAPASPEVAQKPWWQTITPFLIFASAAIGLGIALKKRKRA